jgi:Xaa-Pro dipeptidase
MTELEQARSEQLLEAQAKAEALFHEVEARGMIRAGITESKLNEDIYQLAREMYGITTYWHKRIVRAGANTLLPYAENPPDLIIQTDDILFVDLGPVFEQWEADFGRTFALGSDPAKHKLSRDVGLAFATGKKYFNEQPNITGAELYSYAQALAVQYGWEFGGPMAGHLIGQFPHERIPEDKVSLYIHPKSHLPMSSLDDKGHQRHWILEIHFVDKERQIGGFYEELLTVG